MEEGKNLKWDLLNLNDELKDLKIKIVLIY